MNSDSTTHSYQACAIVSDNSAKYTDMNCAVISDLAGSNANGTATLTFSSPIDVTDATKVDISVEETK